MSNTKHPTTRKVYSLLTASRLQRERLDRLDPRVPAAVRANMVSELARLAASAELAYATCPATAQ